MEAKRAKTGLTPEERQLYEHNLSKFKDERDAIQKKTFTKWVNKHLKKANRHVDDLFTDLQDGLNLISLLEVLSGEHLHREKGRMRFHALQNVELVLNFLRYKKIKLVNIRPEDIVDGNPKLTLGLIWTIILHFQISDIVLSQREENVSPKEVLLKWAKKSTARYPEVRVSDFTSSWRDGLAFNALIHRNRPDLFEWRTVKTKTVRDRLEHAFYNAEKVGVTRLLDPEDVDTHEIDEKSIITYISSLYDVFPEPPAKHPLFDNESQTLTQEYREVASSLHLWIRENTSIFSERTLPATLNDLVKASQESSRFKTYELPSKQPERQRLTHLYTELQKIYESTGQVDIEPELHIDVLDRNYQKLLSIHQERDQQLQDEIKKFERLDRLADRLSRDCKRVDSRLDDVETRVSEESKRLERLHPLDAKRNAESLESEMRSIEETINSLFQDLNILKTVGHSASSSLDRKVNKLHQKWVALRSSLHSKLIARLASVSFPVVEERTVTRQTRTVLETRLVDTNHHFRSLQQAIEWCKAKIKLINESELGNDLAGVKIELAHHEREHKEIDRFKTTVEQCAAAKTQFTGEEHALYLQHLNNLHKVYSELLTTSNKRMSDLESLLDYLQSLQNQLQWLSDKEAIEVARDWSDPNINLMSVQHYHDNLMSELEKREVSVRSVLERGNSLVLQNHPAGKTISRWTELLKEAWSRLLQFSLACEIHTEATRKYQEYTKDLREAEAWLQSRDELLNTVYSASEFSLDEGERLLKGMQEMREELNKKAPLFAELTARAAKIPPIRQRRLPVTRPIQVTAVCNYTSDKVYIEKEDTWLLHDNSALTQWRVSSLSSRGEDTNVPGVVFFIPPPGKELLESAERLNRAFESTTQLWQKKHMRLRQNMIFATIRVVRSWDLAQFISMGADQRNAIRRALNEDADKLLSEGDPSDPQLRRLRREMDEVNRLFEELERRARQEDEQKVALREFTETSNRIQLSLDEYERTLNSRILNSIARDPHTLERLILQHHDFEKDLKSFTPEIENIQTLYNALARKSHQHTLKVESLLQQWNTIWNYSHLYTERLKCVEIVLASLDEARNVVSELEIKLASFGELPSELETLKDLQDDLVRLQNAIAARQPVVDQLIDDATNTRRVVVRSRDRTSEREHGDLDRLDEDVNSVTRRWNDLCANLVDRLRSCDAAGQLLDNFGQSYQTEIKFIDESYKQLNDLPPVSHAKHHIEPTKVLFTSIVERTQPLEQVNIDGGRFIREAKQAMEEKYKLCDDSLRQLLEWMGEVEDRLARQEPASENLDGIRDQLNHLKLIKEELESQQRIVQSCLDDVRNVITNGQEYLSRDELMTLERSAKSLKTRYDRSNSTCDRLLRRLQSAYEELSKFRTEANTFADWLGKTKRVLNEKEKNLKNDNVTELLNDIISHQADLRFITMASQKFADESKEFLNNINEYRNTLASRPGLVEPYPSELKKFVAELTREYKELSSRIKDLSDKISGLGGRQREYKLALERVRTWMQNAEPRANKILSEPLAADPHSLDEQLARAKSINAEFQGQGRLFDHLKQSLELLLRSIEGQASRSEMHELAQPVEELTSKYEMISNSIAKRIENLDNALAQSQGVEQSLENVVSWLSNAENNIKSLTRPASLNKARLEEQVRSVRGPLTEIVAYRGTIENVVVLARNLVSSSTNPRLATRIEAKVKDVLSRYEKLLERSTKLSENFNEVTAALDEFMQHANEIETWLQESMDGLAVGGAGAIDVVSVERDAKREPIERVLREGRNLLARKDVTDTSQIRDRMKNIETQWRDLNMLLDEKVRLSKMRAEQSLAYDKLRDHIIAWLNSFEGKIARLEPVALQMELIKKQTEDLKPLVKEHREFAPTIDRLFDLGTSLESVERPESPTRRRSSVSPVKRLSSIGRKSSQEMTSPTPTKIYVTSPMSPVSSGFGSRRSSQEVYHGEDYTGVQQEVAELNNRYSSLGVKLAERSAELDSVREELRKSLENLRSLDTFLERTSRSMPRDGLCANRDEAEKTNKLVKSLLEEMYEKQSLLDSTKNTINELLKRKNGADLKKQLDDVCAKWKSLYDACKNRIEILDSLKDFYDTHDHLSTWLGAKERMIGALGPISSDPRMVQSQVEQVQVLREELRAMRPQLSHLEIITGTLVQKTKWTPLEAKLKNISDRWTSLAQKLDERASNLGAAVDSSREFDSGLNRLRETLNNISDQIDAAANEKDHEQHLRKIQSCERQLEGARQLLAEAEAAGEELCKVLTDAASRAEIQAKLAAVNKQYNALQAKLDRRKAEIENFLKDAREFDATLAKTSGWINDELGSLNDRLLISAHKDILQQQYDFHEPIYKDVINREHQVVMLFDKASSSKRNLENLRSAWDKLKKEISDRHARLSTSLQHCKKFYANLDSFVPWLATSEARLESLRPESFSRRDLDKHLRDLTSFRNDIWKKSGEFEHLRSTGETFVASCDIDKDIVLQEIASAKNRWDRLNNDLLLKTSTLEELGRRLADASDRLRSLTHSVQRCEDRLGSHDSISTQSDPATIARLNALRDEVQSLRKPHEQLRGLCSELDDQVSEVSNGRTSGLKDEVDGLADRLDDLSSRLQDRCDRAQLAAKAAQNYYDKIKNLTVDLTNLEDEFHQMKPPGRDLKVLKGQQDELGMFNNKLNRAGDEVSTIQALSENLDSEGARQQAENIAKRLSSLESASRRREESLENALDKLYDFLNKAKTADELLNRALDDYKKLKPVGSEPDTIRSQQDESASLRANIVDPAGSAVESALSSGQILVQTANPGVNTAQVERECDRISQKWNDLKEKMTDRDKRLNVGLLQSGKFQEALEGLSKWLADMEDLVANQKPPSADFKVVKAQLQEQKFLKKMLLDRQGSINSLFVMGREVASNCGPSEGNAIERQLKNLSDRFEDLNTKADSRMNALEKAMNIARLFQDKITSLSDWLFKTEKKIKDMHTVPTDEEKIQNKIREHESLHSEIMRRKSEFNEVTDIAANLASLVSEDDATLVADQVQEAIDRYSKLVNDSENVSHILESARQKLRHLVVTYQQLQGWMENMESRLARFKVLAVHTEQLYAQMEDLADLSEEISNQQNNVDSTIDSGHELMRSISSDEAIQLKDKLDSLQRRYNDLTTRGAELLKQAQEALPLVQQFHNSHNKLVDWMHSAETTLQNAEPREESIHALEMDIQEFRPVLETVNQLGPQLCAIGPGEGAATIEGLVTRDNRRFDAISEQVQRKAERLQLCKQRSLEVLSDVDSLLEWFREVEAQLREAEPPNGDPQVIRLQLKEHKALNDDIASQKGRVRDVLDTAKKVLRESPQYEDNSVMRDKMVDLRETMDNVWKASGDRLNLLELALGLAQHFETSHSELAAWLDEKTSEAKNLRPSSLRPQALMQDQVVTQRLLQSITEHKPLMDKLNKTGESLIKIVSYEEGVKIQDVLDNDNARYNELRNLLKQRQEALEKALQESSEFADKLEGMLRALSNAADEMNSAEPVSAHPPKIRQQIKENQGLIDDIGKREEAFEAVKKAAGDVIAKSPNDPAVKDIKKKLEKLQQLWKEVNDATKSRNKSLSQALEVAAKFWAALESVMTTLAEIERTLMEQEPPALKPELVRRQGEALGLVKNEIDSAKPRVEDVRKTGQSLMALCGDADKTEVRKNIEDLDSAWDTVTTLFARREENLLDAMERAMEFHETLRALKEFLQDAERRFAALGPLGEDIGTIRNQMKEVKDLKASLDPMMIKVESLNRQAAELTERSTADQAMGLKESLTSVNNRWDELHRGIAERYRQLENALLRLGQFQTALSELLTWIANTEKTLDTEMSVVAVDPHLLEVQLAKLKVLMNDMSAHQNSVDTLNDAGRQIVEENPTDDKTQDRLKDLNKKWKNLITKASEKQSELEEALRQGQRFSAEIQDLLAYLGEVDSVIASSKPVGGLPETASEQLERFMIVYNELEETRPRIESAISHGNDLIRKNPDSSSYTQNNLKTLKSRWDNVISRANDKKIKLEIALKEAVEFHDALQAFVNWLTSAEKTLSSLKPVSRVLETILNQIEDHKNFQKEVGVHRETMLNLDKKGNHLKYFSQKQDVILIKNLLISVQHRWEKVVSKSAERTRSLDHGYKEAKDFHDSWSNLINFLKETDQKLDDIETSNDPVKLRQKLTKHREIQKSLTGKQIIYDATLRQGKNLKEKAPKSDENTLKMMLQELKDMWTSVNNKVLLKQRNLEESLLYCGQVKDALDALLDFLKKANKELADDVVHGDLDTVQGLIERHRSLEQDIQNRRSQIESLERSELLSEQISELSELWKKTNVLCQKKNVKLQSALKMAEELHKNVHNLLEFLSDSESKLRNWELSDDETELRVALQEHERFLDEIKDKERDKNMTIRLAEEILSKAHPDAVNTIKHWISIIQSRWEEITSWSRQKTERLKTHLRSLQDMDSLLEELLAYLGEKESNLISLEHQELPKTSVETNILIEEHQRFMESMAKRTTEIDVVIKAKTIKERKQSKKSGSTQEINEITRRQSLRSSREQLAERRMSRSSGKDYSDPTLPHFGPKFPTKGSKTPEPQFKCARSRLLYDRWRSVWLMSWERQRRLRDHLLHLGELERLANFSWDEWRKRFLRFMNHKKSRLTDLFRKMDKNNDNLIPRDDFVNGIINTKFDTNRPEMGAVADMFDHNSEGYIDWKEFIAALRPDWEERQPSTEAEKIHDEVKRLVMLCTCRQKFRVFQVGEGKYRFGDSQKLRLVRILRSTVMVRVGGGWQALEEFLVKNDPCRAKGRTNIELREQFILPEGVSQSMSAFKPKLSTEKKSSSPLPTAGPITKIREKSSKSVPMASSRGTPGSVDSLSDLDSPHTPGYMMPRKSSMRVPSSSTPGSLPGSRSNSRPQSRTNSKPPSRHASNLSLASSDDGTPSRIPRMSVPSRSSSSASGTQRKLTAPGALNGSKSPSGRTPSGRTTPKSSR